MKLPLPGLVDLYLKDESTRPTGSLKHRLARELDGHFLDQFIYAERATYWRANNNIAESALAQMELEPHSVPLWIVVGAGTGGTATTFGRNLRLRGTSTRLCVVDPEGSAFFPSYQGLVADGRASRIEGIGRPRVEPSFVPTVVDRMLSVPDGASVAAMRSLSHRLGISAGPSTGTNVFGALRLACEMNADRTAGSIVTLMYDSGSRYTAMHDDDAWLTEQGIDIHPYLPVVERAWDDQVWACPSAGRGHS